jgi:radical SAM superfamily enzyme YgiQ (UPF0313 family)
MSKQKILLVYIGNEQGSWGATAYPSPAHYYFMPGILYCSQSLRNDPWVRERFEVSWRFFNATVQSREEILEAILGDGAAVVGFSVFCWNVTETFWLAQQIRERRPDCRIAGGGPEVSLKNTDEAAEFFAKNPGFDLLVFGEAESKIAALIKALVAREPLPMSMTGFAFSPRDGGTAEFTKGYIENPEQIPSIYPFSLEVKRSQGCGIAMVYETGRGCPYRCIYCQFSHRNHKPYRFTVERVKRELAWLFEQGIECIHFADAVFDMDPGFSKEILTACLSLNRRTSLFFYCSFYRLDEDLARLFALSQAQVCVGVQTTNPRVLAKINRALSPRLFQDIRGILAKHSLNFYVDLIFGLPLDTVASFRKSFADVVELGPSFVMEFPLTLVKGTPLEQRAADYGMIVYDKAETATCGLMCGIEYANIALHREFSLKDLSDFDDLALALFYFYNRFRLSLSYLEKRCAPHTALLYQSIGAKTKSFLRKTGQTATNTNFISGFEDEIRAIFMSEAATAGAGTAERLAFEEIFKLDVFRILMINAPQREKMFAHSSDAHARTPRSTDRMRTLSDQSRILRIAPGKAVNCAFRLADLRQLHALRETIRPSVDIVYISAPFSRWDVQVFSLSPLERLLLDIIPADRPLTLKHLLQAVQRVRVAGGNDSFGADAVRDVIASLETRGIITV